MDPATHDEAALVGRCCAQPPSREALAELVRLYGPLVLQTVTWTFRHHCRHREHEAGDVFQQVFVSLMENRCSRLKSFDPSKGRLSTFLAAVARNAALNAMGSVRSGIVELTDEIVDGGSGADEWLERVEMSDKVESVIAECTAAERLFFHLYFEEFMPPGEIATVLGVSVDSVYSKKAKLIDKIRLRLAAVVREVRG